jgi:hypothetical protein
VRRSLVSFVVARIAELVCIDTAAEIKRASTFIVIRHFERKAFEQALRRRHFDPPHRTTPPPDPTRA